MDTGRTRKHPRERLARPRMRAAPAQPRPKARREPSFFDRMHHGAPFSARTGTTGRSIASYPGPDTSARGAASGSSSFAASASCAGRSGPWAKGHAGYPVRLQSVPERASLRRRPSRKSEGRRGAKTSFGLEPRSHSGLSCAGSRGCVR